ncbi:Uncharacterised protein [Enterobacter cloacae]|jgi:hypothetical protein|nr:hypothetical protein [Enterobacter asburiae]SAD10058.1 Uncharacterised protein [Enterobacter cloacae]
MNKGKLSVERLLWEALQIKNSFFLLLMENPAAYGF